MKVVISLCTFAAAALAVAGAPANVFVPEPFMYNGPQIPYFRDRRSAYGGGYASPCGASLPLAQAGGYLSPVHAGYGYGGGHAAYGGVPSYGGYGGPHYRADEESEILNISDMEPGMTEHMPMARYGGYGAAAAAPAAHSLGGLGGLGGQLVSAGASGPAIGVFPNANGGGCNVPLLLSCSPSIVPGRLVKSSGYGGGYGGGAQALTSGGGYRGVEDQGHHDSHEEHVEEMTHDSTEHLADSTHTESHQ